MSLLNYWPIADEINKCIKHEAEGANDAVLLAVHRPSPLSYRLYSSTEKISTNEEELFDYLMSDDVAEGVHIVPITGASGAGKSHMVRILNARLQSFNGDGKFVVIRIPKSASLRTVVELILEQLEGDQYAQVKADFASALTEDLDIENMVVKFQAELDIALQQLAIELSAKRNANPGNATLNAQLGHATWLPKFFGDPILVDHFRTNVFKRFVQRALAGQRESEQESFVEDFVPNDLRLPDDIDLAQGAKSTNQYYRSQLLPNDGMGMHVATSLLNEKNIGDRAIRQLFKLHQSLGGMTLHEVILKIREQLLVQGRELVIFVEDFKALIGIQDTLLKILIQEGERENVQNYATLRSVIAVTDGYLATEDSFGTRAKREWRVESEFTNEQNVNDDQKVLKLTKALVAGYLNAARWGFEKLVHHFETKEDTGDDQGTWIQPYFDQEDDDETVLKAFGTVDEIPLFPFTERAIEQLARTALITNGKLLFTPRFIIDHILRDLLLKGRPAFEQGQFPPPSINMPKTKVEITRWLNQYNGVTKERYQRVVGIWGNEPETVEDVGYIPKEVFDAFKLGRPNIEFKIPPVERDTQGGETKPPPTPPPRTDDAPLVEALEKWVQGERLDQEFAKQIRISVATALDDRMDWNAERCMKILKIQPAKISIPNAMGEGNIANNPIQVADDYSDPSGQIRSELAAVTRLYLLNKGKIAYENADDDMVWVGSLVDRLMPQALTTIRAEIQQKLGGALRLLQTNSQILGLVVRGNTPASLAPFLFDNVENPPSLPADCNQAFADWYALKNSALSVRPELIQKVVSFCGSFQGTGDTLYAIDMIRLANLLRSEPESINPRELGFTNESVQLLQDQLRESPAKTKANNVLKVATTIRTALTDEFGESFDKQVIVDEFEAMADQLGECGAWNDQQIGMGKQAFKNRCKDFGKAAVREALDTLSSAVDEGDAQFLSRMGRLNLNPLIVASNFLEKARLVIRVASRHAEMLETQFNNVNPAAEAAEIQEVLQNLSLELDSFAVKGEAS